MMVALPEMLLIAIIAVPFLGSCLAILFPANARNAEAYLAGIVAVVALVSVVATYPRVTDGGIVQYNAAWIPELGLEFSLRMDGFAWLMATLITVFGVLFYLADTIATALARNVDPRLGAGSQEAVYA